MSKIVLLLVFVGFIVALAEVNFCPQDCLCRKTFWRCSGESVTTWPLDNIPRQIVRGVRMLDLSGTSVNVLPNWPPTHNFPDLELILLYNTVYDGHQCRELECLEDLKVKVLAPRCTPEKRTNCPHPTCCHWEKIAYARSPSATTDFSFVTSARDGMRSTIVMAPTDESGKHDTSESPPTVNYETGDLENFTGVTFVATELSVLFDLTTSSDITFELPAVKTEKSGVISVETDSTAENLLIDFTVPVTDKSFHPASSDESSSVFGTDIFLISTVTALVEDAASLSEENVHFPIVHADFSTNFSVYENMTAVYPSDSSREITESSALAILESAVEVLVPSTNDVTRHKNVTQGSMESDDLRETLSTAWSQKDVNPITFSTENNDIILPINHTVEHMIEKKSGQILVKSEGVSIDPLRVSQTNDNNPAQNNASVFNPLIAESEPTIINGNDIDNYNETVNSNLSNPDGTDGSDPFATDTLPSAAIPTDSIIDILSLEDTMNTITYVMNASDFLMADLSVAKNGTLSTNASRGNHVRLGLSMDMKAVIGTVLGVSLLLIAGLLIYAINRCRTNRARTRPEATTTPTAPEGNGMENENYYGPGSRAFSDTSRFSPAEERSERDERLAETRYNRIWGGIRNSISHASSYFSFPGSSHNPHPEARPSADVELSDMSRDRGHSQSSHAADDGSFHSASGPGQESGSGGERHDDFARGLDERTQYFVGRWGGRRLSDPEFTRGMAAYSASTIYDTLGRDDKGAELVADGIRDFRQVSREARLTGQFQRTRDQQLDQRDIHDERRRNMNKHVPYYGA